MFPVNFPVNSPFNGLQDWILSCTKSTASSSVAADLRELRCGRRSWGELFFLLQNQHRQWCSRVDAWTSAELNMPQLNYLAMWWPGIYIYKHYIVVSNLSICLSIYLSIYNWWMLRLFPRRFAGRASGWMWIGSPFRQGSLGTTYGMMRLGSWLRTKSPSCSKR